MSAPRVLAVDRENPDPRVLEEAARVLREGGVVAFPTETLYGLAADPWNPAALERILRVKGRPEEKGIPVLVGAPGALSRLAASVPPAARDLAARHWPGPLTLVLPAAPGLPAAIAPGGGVAVRWSSGRLAARLARAAGGAITATSANRSGDPIPALDPRRVASLLDDEGVALLLDAGVLPESPASTVVDARGETPRLLRAGPVVLADGARNGHPGAR